MRSFLFPGKSWMDWLLSQSWAAADFYVLYNLSRIFFSPSRMSNFPRSLALFSLITSTIRWLSIQSLFSLFYLWSTVRGKQQWTRMGGTWTVFDMCQALSTLQTTRCTKLMCLLRSLNHCLAGMASGVAHWPLDQEGWGSILGQGTSPRCGLDHQ